MKNTPSRRTLKTKYLKNEQQNIKICSTVDDDIILPLVQVCFQIQFVFCHLVSFRFNLYFAIGLLSDSICNLPLVCLQIQFAFHELPANVHQSLRDSLMEHASKVTPDTAPVIITQVLQPPKPLLYRLYLDCDITFYI